MSIKITTVQIDERTRVTAWYAEYADNPLYALDFVSVHPIRQNYRFKTPPAGKDSRADTIDTIVDYDGDLKKHFERAGVPYRIVSITSDRDWVGEYVFYLESNDHNLGIEYLDSVISKYQQYADGEVYEMTLERAEEWTSESGVKKLEWTTAESASGFYADFHDETVLREYARECFGV